VIRVCLILAAFAGTASAQSSPRAGGPVVGDDPGAHLALDSSITGNIARGFVDRELISARGILQGWTGPYGFYMQPYWLYGRVGTPMGKLTTDNEIYVRTGLFRRLVDPFFAYGVTVYDRSVRRQIEHRNLAGAGLGLNIIQRKDLSLVSSVGLLYELTDYGGIVGSPLLENGTTSDGVRETGRWSVRIYGRYKIAGGKLGLIHDLIVIPSLRDPADDYRILSYFAIDAPIAKGFSARVQADYTREGLIVAGTKHDDLALTFGIAYKAEWLPTKKPAAPAPTK
jgi:hypothetical protein